MHLTLHLTRACNLRCSYCYAPPRAREDMTADTALQTLQFGVRHNENTCGIVLFGGEPLLLDEGCRYLIVSLNYAAPWHEAELEELARQYERLGDLYIEWTRQGRKSYLSPFEVKLSSHIQGEDACKEHCELGIRQISVDPQGFLFPCVQFTAAGPASRWCIGDVVSGIDMEKRNRLHDESQDEKEPCRKCAIRRRCHNTCGCLNWQTTGSVTRVSPVLCRHEQMLLPIADRIGETLYQEQNPLLMVPLLQGSHGRILAAPVALRSIALNMPRPGWQVNSKNGG